MSFLNTDLLAYLPLDAKRVLEIGRGQNILASAYKARNPDAHYTAVEQAAFCVASPLDIFSEKSCNLSKREPCNIGQENSYDLVVLDETLGLFLNPEETLREIHRLVADDGLIAICIPNAGHWSVILDLIAGRSPTYYSGGNSNTKPHTFTLESINGILERAGFQGIKVRARRSRMDKDTQEHALPALVDLAQRLGHNRQAFADRITAWQYVLLARKQNLPAKPTLRLHVAAMAPRFLDVRARLPADALNTLADLVVTRAEKTLQVPSLSPSIPKICVLQRLAISNTAAYLNWVRDRVADGWVLVAESDDHPALLATVHGRDPSKESWIGMTSVHAIQTSTPALADVFRQHNATVACFPNAVFEIRAFQKRPGPLRIFLGALNRERITKIVARSLSRFCERHREVEFVVMHDRAFYENLPTEHKKFIPASDYATYLDAMNGCHVALMPLEGTFGERFKSDVKFLEASSCSVVSIASPAVYENSIIDGETGLIARSIDDWSQLLSVVATNTSLRNNISYNAWRHVQQTRMFAQQVDERRRWYFSLWDRRRELNASLLNRHPELI